MSDETKRAGANPAEPTPKKATLESVLPAAANRAVALAILQLEDNLNEAARLLAQCSLLTVAPYDQSLAAMRTATRLLRNQSDAAQALARVARGETRHRTIVEYVQGAESDGRLNSNFFGSPPPPRRGAATKGKHDGKKENSGPADQ